MVRLFAFVAFAALLAVGALVKSETVVTLRADDFYPLSFSPDASVIVGDVQTASDGSVVGMHVSEYAGSPADCIQHTHNGVCCTCNVTRGDTPECGFIVRDSFSTISTDCTQTWPPGHFGGSSPEPAFVTVVDGHASHHHRMRHKHRRPE